MRVRAREAEKSRGSVSLTDTKKVPSARVITEGDRSPKSLMKVSDLPVYIDKIALRRRNGQNRRDGMLAPRPREYRQLAQW